MNISMNSTILNLFGTGQVTLPKKWREKFKTKHFKAEIQDDKLVLTPLKDDRWITIFDADEFNDGEGVEIGIFYKALKKSLE